MTRGFWSNQFTDEDYKQRLKSKCLIDPFLGCWLYQGFRHRLGYGDMSYRCVTWRVHRLAYALWKGQIPPDKEVMHKCDVRRCCNPEHLELGTHKDNLLDCFDKGRQPKAIATHCAHGHEFSPGNTRVNKCGSRSCRMCDRIKNRLRMGWSQEQAKSLPKTPRGQRPVGGSVPIRVGRKLKTICKHGHPLSGENLYITSEGRRRCRACHYRHVRETAERYSDTSTCSNTGK